MTLKNMLFLRSIDAMAQLTCVAAVLLHFAIRHNGSLSANAVAACFFYLALEQLVSCIITLFLPSALTNKRVRITYLVFSLVLVVLGVLGLLFWVLFLPIIGLVMTMTTWYFIVTVVEIFRLKRQTTDTTNEQ